MNSKRSTVGLIGLVAYLLLAIGVVLSFIPYVGFIAFAGVILAGVAWIMLGVESRDKFFLVTGILLIAVIIVVYASAYVWAYNILGMIKDRPQAIANPEEFIANLIDQAATYVAVLALITWPMEAVHSIAHIRLGKLEGIGVLRFSGYTRIAILLLNIAASITLTQALLENKYEIARIISEYARKPVAGQELGLKLMTLIGKFSLPLTLGLLALILLIAANIMSAIGFNKIRTTPSETTMSAKTSKEKPLPPPP